MSQSEIIKRLLINYEIETFKMILIGCQRLESIKVRVGGQYLNENELLEMVVNHSPKNFYELRLCYAYGIRSEIFPDELESFLISWTNRIPQKSLSFIIIEYTVDNFKVRKGNIEVIEKYIKLGVIKTFRILDRYGESAYIFS